MQLRRSSLILAGYSARDWDPAVTSTLQGVVRQKAGRPLWGRTSAGVFGIDREAAFYFCSQMRDRVLTARPQLVFVQARQNRRTGTIAKIQKPSKKLTRPSREEGNA
jgi:hypothetical protein